MRDDCAISRSSRRFTAVWPWRLTRCQAPACRQYNTTCPECVEEPGGQDRKRADLPRTEVGVDAGVGAGGRTPQMDPALNRLLVESIHKCPTDRSPTPTPTRDIPT
jgi:hypothetical protein